MDRNNTIGAINDFVLSRFAIQLHLYMFQIDFI